MTQGQVRALSELWPQFGLDPPDAPFHLSTVFGREASTVVEIGFGNGDHLFLRAQAEPDKNFLGVEVHRPGAGRLLMRAQQAGLHNLRVACFDAVEVLRDWLPQDCLSEVLIYFPDPWHKKRHHKRRLVQPEFVRLVASRLAVDGHLRLATDWAHYAEQMLTVLNAEPLLRNQSDNGGFIPRPAARSVTKFETRGTKLGHGVFDLDYTRVG